jgi:hypothetical protein
LDPDVAAEIDRRAASMTITELADFGIRAARELLAAVEERDGQS